MCKQQKVLRFVNSDVENYAWDRPMLYTPWRREPEDLLGGHDTFQESLQARKTQVDKKMEEYEPNKTLTVELLAEVHADEHADQIVAPTTERTTSWSWRRTRGCDR